MREPLVNVNKVSEIRLGEAPAFDAWFYTFRAENNIEHHINPAGVAGPEQLAFMAAVPEGGIYVPCADVTFFDLLEGRRARRLPDAVLKQYAGAWRIVMRIVTRLTRGNGGDEAARRERRRTMLAYCRNRFQGCLALGCILPSRLIKRLVTTIVSQMEGEDPWQEERQEQNRRALAFLQQQLVHTALNALPKHEPHASLTATRRYLDYSLLARFFVLGAHMAHPVAEPPVEDNVAAPDESPEGVSAVLAEAERFVPVIRELVEADPGDAENIHPLDSRTFLFVCDTDGGLLFDLCIIGELIRQGHKVVLAVKEQSFFLAPTLADLDQNPVLADYLAEGLILRGASVTKNELVRRLREHRLLIISDGTSERMNLYRTSTTFARAWKECDAVIAKGRRNKEIFLDVSTGYTRDVFCFWKEDETVHLRMRPRGASVRKFNERDLSLKASGIIRAMRAAKNAGRAVMFYSCVIGSIPGQTAVAVQVAHTFVDHLRGLMDDVFIINPADYFEEGMDGDDLMFMWEQVQRSGLINIWRFQSVDDIETSFALMGRKVPPVWSGKDATFSTGCTKEMRIALDMQRSHPELQIIGPAADKFFRRGDYGVGKYFDATIYSPQQDTHS